MLMQNSEITFFRLETRKHSNFSIEAIDQTVNGTPGFERSISCTISRNGDLINRVYVEAKLPKLDIAVEGNSTTTWIPNVGAHLIDHADIEIGGQRIDRHYGQWLSIWNELTGEMSQKDGYDRMIGNKPNLLNPWWTKNGTDESTPGTTNGTLRSEIASDTVLVPLAFWFCRSPGLALPLIALQYHEVKLNITFAKMTDLLRTWHNDNHPITTITIDKAQVLTDEYTISDGTNTTANILASATADEIENALSSATPAAITGHKVSSVTLLVNGTSDGTIVIVRPKGGGDLTIAGAATGQNTAGTPTNTGYFGPYSASDAKASTSEQLEVKLWVDYCFLDNDERRFMATKPHKYLIEQLQYSGKEAIRGGSDRFRLNFNHPTKMLVWCVESQENIAGLYSYPGMKAVTQNAAGIQYGQANDLNNAEEGIWCGRNPIASGKLVLNGHDRFKEREGYYFDTVQPYQHMNNTPQRPGINMFSFGLKPGEFQPSGSINMSRLDNATLDLTYHKYSGNSFYTNATVSIFATSYNQLRIISGMGGLTYSN
jgi:hypothetical protein